VRSAVCPCSPASMMVMGRPRRVVVVADGCEWPGVTGPGVSAGVRGIAGVGSADAWSSVRAGGVLWAGERERGVVGRVEDLEVWQAGGEAHDDPPGSAHDPAGDAE